VATGELDALAEHLRQTGEQVRWDDALADVRRFYSQDPWGNRIELLSAGWTAHRR
jgi:hypothetical protein